MATIRETNTSALLVIDVQNGAVEGAWNREKVIANVAAAVELARAEGAPVIWVQHADEELVEGTEAWRYVPELVAAPGEPRASRPTGVCVPPRSARWTAATIARSSRTPTPPARSNTRTATGSKPATSCASSTR